jgi:2,3-bisphosphoglycerate-independent phosphoglycerate mutase
VQADPSLAFFVLVTSDHSTPVMFGDHSHEPVPLAVAPVAAVASSIGPATVLTTTLGPLPPLTQHSIVEAEALQEQATLARQRREAALEGREWAPGMWGRLPWVVATDGDRVVLFDEVSAAQGALGRFPSSELMTFVRSLLRAA